MYYMVNFTKMKYNVHSRKQSMTIEQPTVSELKISLCTVDKLIKDLMVITSCNDP